MRDYEAERDKPSVTRTYESADGTRSWTSRGPLKPYNELLIQLAHAADVIGRQSDAKREAFKQLAWCLGMHGEHDACEMIMSEITPKMIVTPIGIIPVY